MTDKEFNKALGTSIKVARKKFGYTQRDMAAILNIRQPTYCSIESGARNTTIFKMAIIMKTLGILALPDVEGKPLIPMEKIEEVISLQMENKEPWPEKNDI